MSQEYPIEDRQLKLNFENSCFPDMGVVTVAGNVFHIASFRCLAPNESKNAIQRPASESKMQNSASDEKIVRQVLDQAKHLSW